MEGLSQSGIEGLDASLIPQMSPVGAFINAVVGSLLSWLVWAALTYFIGSKLFGASTDMGEMLRVIGFAQAPRLLSGLSFIPCLGGVLSLVGWVWALAASFVGIREGLDLDTGKTVITIVLAFIAAFLVSIADWHDHGPDFRDYRLKFGITQNNFRRKTAVEIPRRFFILAGQARGSG